MCKHRTKRKTAFVAFAMTVVMAGAAAAQNQDDKKPPSTSGATQQPASGASTGSGDRSGPDQTVFRPKETIAPGKPVSFPADI